MQKISTIRNPVLVLTAVDYGFPSLTFDEAYPCAHLRFFHMTYDSRFGPSAQTPEQRTWVLAQMQATLPNLKTKAPAFARQLYARYIAGELSWLDVDQALHPTA